MLLLGSVGGGGEFHLPKNTPTQTAARHVTQVCPLSSSPFIKDKSGQGLSLARPSENSSMCVQRHEKKPRAIASELTSMEEEGFDDGKSDKAPACARVCVYIVCTVLVTLATPEALRGCRSCGGGGSGRMCITKRQARRERSKRNAAASEQQRQRTAGRA